LEFSVADPVAAVREKVRGQYEIGREIGQGAFATVYLARDLRHDRSVAFKILNVAPSSQTAELRFIREIRLLARLQHPNIVSLFDSGYAETSPYYVMPYVSGESLGALLRRERRVAVRPAIQLVFETADALSYAHKAGVIHRDIKPDNILMSAGHAVVADFGVAKALADAGLQPITQTGVGPPGTPDYMSPEHLMGERNLDQTTDVYSLGCVLYEVLTGNPPFMGKSGFVTRFTEPPPRPTASDTTLPTKLDFIVAKALARAPKDRYSTAAEFKHALESLS
jgi:serine/threonine protein kinase